jgi:hypothetical protein
VEPGEFWQNLAANPIIIILAIVGSLASIYGAQLTSAQNRRRQLAYSIHRERESIRPSTPRKGVDIQFHGKPLAKAVSVARVAFWNCGKETIRKENLMLNKRIEIATKKKERILEVSLKDASRDGVLGFQGSPSIADMDRSHQAWITWEALETNDYLIVEIIYEGNSTTEFKVIGDIEGKAPLKQWIGQRDSSRALLVSDLTHVAIWAVATIFLVRSIWGPMSGLTWFYTLLASSVLVVLICGHLTRLRGGYPPFKW